MVTDRGSTDNTPLAPTRLAFQQSRTEISAPFVNTQSQQPAQLLSLWNWYRQQQGLQLQQPDAAQLGNYVYAARLESSPSLSPGTGCLSGSLCQSLAAETTAVTVYNVLHQSSEATPPSKASTGSMSARQDVVYARMLLDSNTGEPRGACNLVRQLWSHIIACRVSL